MNNPLLIHQHIVQQLNKSVLPTFFEMSLDYLPVQASAVLSEQVFLLSAEMDTKKRNCIKPVLMEVLQMLKFALKQSAGLYQGLVTSESAMQGMEPDGEDLLGELLGLNSEDTINKII
jgi:hypothetical protein